MKRLQNYIEQTTVNNRASLENQIEDLEQQLVGLRNELSSNEERNQRQLTAVGALGTAIRQVLDAIALCEDINEQGLIDVFWEEIHDIKDGNYVATPALTSAEPEVNEDGLSDMKISDLKEFAKSLKITNNYVKLFGSLRARDTWLKAINEFKKDSKFNNYNNEDIDDDNETIDVNTVIDVTSNDISTEDKTDNETTGEETKNDKPDNVWLDSEKQETNTEQSNHKDKPDSNSQIENDSGDDFDSLNTW